MQMCPANITRASCSGLQSAILVHAQAAGSSIGSDSGTLLAATAEQSTKSSVNVYADLEGSAAPLDIKSVTRNFLCTLAASLCRLICGAPEPLQRSAVLAGDLARLCCDAATGVSLELDKSPFR